MKRFIITLSLVALSGHVDGGEWYEKLHPGITRTEIVELAGAPTSSSKSVEKYDQEDGYVELRYDAEVLVDCTHHYNYEYGVISRSLYSVQGGKLEADHIQERRTYLTDEDFLSLPNFKGPRIYASGYYGSCYMVDDGFIVVTPMISLLGGYGHFADKAAKITLVDSKGQSNVLYRAISEWHELQPPTIDWSQMYSRTTNLLSLGTNSIGKTVVEIFGPTTDSGMGSGMDYRLFYLENALAVVSVDGATTTRRHSSGTISGVWIIRPGLDSLSLAEWKKLPQQESVVPFLRGEPPRLDETDSE